MKARVILHEDGITKFVQTVEASGIAVSTNGLTLFKPDGDLLRFEDEEWNKLEVDK